MAFRADPAHSPNALRRAAHRWRAGVLTLAVASTTILAAVPSPARAASIGEQLVVDNLLFPAAFAVAPDGRIFYGERFTGAIRIYDPSNGNNTLFGTIDNLLTAGEQGLLGLALDPGYPGRPLVYVYATRNVNGIASNQILRMRDEGGTASPARAIFGSNVPAQSIHNGGHIQFGPDGMLYTVIGEASDPSNAQNLTKSAGKVLRMTRAGGVPADNPFPGSPVFAYGLRNSFGFAFDPSTGNLWEPENGPECNDEVNLVFAGQNDGWGPSETCSTPPSPPANTNQDGPNPVLPLAWFTPTIAPTGTVFCDQCGLTGMQGRFFFGAWNTGEIRSVRLTADRVHIDRIRVVLTHASGIISMERGPDGTVYFSDGSGIFKLVQA
jgi:glucose/arabinose dehydrogenase